MIDVERSFSHEKDKPKTNPPTMRDKSIKHREDGIYIHKDNSGVTYEYEIVKNGEVILLGDANESHEEILEWLHDLVSVVNLNNIIED